MLSWHFGISFCESLTYNGQPRLLPRSRRPNHIKSGWTFTEETLDQHDCIESLLLRASMLSWCFRISFVRVLNEVHVPVRRLERPMMAGPSEARPNVHKKTSSFVGIQCRLLLQFSSGRVQ